MRLNSRLAALTASIALVSCGQADPVLMPVSMPECIYQGPSSMEEGNARISLRLNGLGESGAALVQLTEDRSFDELRAHFENDSRWSRQPSWARTVTELRLERGMGLDDDGVARTVDLSAGSYAVVCIEYPEGEDEGSAHSEAEIEVKAS